MEVRCFHSLAELAPLRDEINALNLSAERPDPFATYEFYENFLTRGPFARSRERMQLWFLAAFHDGHLLGYFALKRVKRASLIVRFSRVECLVAHDGDRPRVMAAAQNASAVSAAFYRYLLAHKKAWSVLEFQQQDASSTMSAPPADASSSGCMVTSWPAMTNWTIPIRWNNLAEYHAAFSAKFRSNIGRQTRALIAAGNVELVCSSDPRSTSALFDLYLTIDRRSWKSHADLSVDGRESKVEYIRGLLEAKQPMRILIQILMLNGMPVAGLICGTFETPIAKHLYALHIAYDHAHSDLSPGQAILLMGVRHAIVGRYASMNLLFGFGYYKSRWLAQEAQTRNIQLYRIGTWPYWSRLLGNLIRHIRPNQVDEDGEIQFNTARRDLTIEEGTTSKESDAGHIQALLQAAREGECEFWSATEFAALMPFSTERKVKTATPAATTKDRKRSRKADLTPS